MSWNLNFNGIRETVTKHVSVECCEEKVNGVGGRLWTSQWVGRDVGVSSSPFHAKCSCYTNVLTYQELSSLILGTKMEFTFSGQAIEQFGCTG